MRKIVLASGSPRRKQILAQIGLKFTIRETDYKENMALSDDPYELVKYLALQKGLDVARHYKNAIIISADTFVIHQGRFIGKPKDEIEAKTVLKSLSGCSHQVVTGFAIIDTKNQHITNDYSEANVKFRSLTEQEINDYIATGEPMDKAGCYGLQERAAVLVESIEGDYYSIVGLPIAKIFVELKKRGINALSFND